MCSNFYYFYVTVENARMCMRVAAVGWLIRSLFFPDMPAIV